MYFYTRILLFISLLSFSYINTFGQNIYLPNDTSCVINVKMPPFNATGNGFTDDTEAIQAAIYASIGGENSKVVYFPEGTYLISEPLNLGLPDGTSTVAGPWLKGESQYSAVLKIDDGNSAFESGISDEYIGILNVSCNNPFIPFAGHKSIENIGFYLGNNATACAINMCGQSNFIKNVRIKGEGVGAGICLGNEQFSSSGLVMQTTLKNTDVGIYCSNDLSNYTLTEVLCIGLNDGIVLDEAMVCIDNLVALETRGIGIKALDTLTNFSILNSTFQFTEAAKQSGNIFSYHNFYARNINLVNSPTITATSPIYGVFDGDTTKIEELYTAPVFKSQSTDYEGMLGIPIKTSQRTLYDSNMDNWVSVADFGADPSDNLDDSVAIQAAMDFAADNGKTTVYFPGCGQFSGESYKLINQYVSIRGTVETLIGLGYAYIEGNGFIVNQNVSPAFTFKHLYGLNINAPVTYENFDVNKTVVFEDTGGIVLVSGSGTAFVNNHTGFMGNANAFSDVYGRSLSNYLLNPADYSEGYISLVNQEGRMWLSGVRAEHPYSILASMNGAKTEIVGGLVMPNYLPDAPPLFITTESEMTIANFKVRGLAANGGTQQYTYDLQQGVNVGNMFHTDAAIPNTIVIYSDADGPDCPPDGTACDDGNPFTTNSVYQNCECVGQKAQLSISALLEGFYNTEVGEMTTELNQARLLPQTQPFNTSPFNYTGTEISAFIPPFVVDWVLVELRNVNDPNIVMYQRPAFLSLDGRIIDIEGYALGTTFPGLPGGNYYVALYHKSHLPIITKEPVNLNNTETAYIDMTSDLNVEGFQPLTDLVGSGFKALFAGDFDQNGLINNLDYNLWLSDNSAVNEYLQQDADGNGIINNLDYNWWIKNRSKVGAPVLHK